MTSSPDPGFRVSPLVSRLLDRMCCPACQGGLAAAEGALQCTECGTDFPVREGIPLLAIPGTVETWSEREEGPSSRAAEELLDARPPRASENLTDAGASTSAEYQTWYQDREEARRYNEEYRERPTKRWSTQREYRLLERLLSGQPRSDVLLDIPSGGGRLSPQLAGHTDVLVEADIGFGQLLYGKDTWLEGSKGTEGDADRLTEGDADRLWLMASAFHIPFRSQSVDGVVCVRLAHHLPTPEERERLVVELLRVARRFVIMSFFDYHSVKNYIRRARRPFDGKPPKMTMTVDQVRGLARENGAELVAQPPLSRLFSGHRYALMVRR